MADQFATSASPHTHSPSTGRRVPREGNGGSRPCISTSKTKKGDRDVVPNVEKAMLDPQSWQGNL